MEHQADVHPQLRLILPDAGPGCEKNGRRATWAVTTRSGRHQVPVAVLPTAKSLSASLKPQSDRLLGNRFQIKTSQGVSNVDIGFIGLGAMGYAVATNLVNKSGYAITVWNRTAAKAESLVAAGAKVPKAPKERGAGKSIVLRMLAEGSALP